MTANIELEDCKDYSIMHLSGDFNGVDENDALYASFRELSKAGKDKLIVDLKEVVYLNSASMGVLLSGNAMITKNVGKMVLYSANDYLMNLFNITKLNIAIPVVRYKDEALELL